MSRHDPDRLVSEFVAGRVSRRELIARLMALGAAATGVDRALAQSPRETPAPTFAAHTVDHLALNVTDVKRSSEWYVKHLGLRPMRATETASFLRCGNGRDFLALFKGDEPGMHHFSFGIDEYDQEKAAARLREAGLTPKLRGRRIYFDDPDSIEVQVSQQ